MSTKTCLKCCSTRPIEEFDVNKHGKVNSICLRHSRKRKFSFIDSSHFDEWDEFENKQNKTLESVDEPLDLKYTFNLDRLPFFFSPYFTKVEEPTPDQLVLRAAMSDLRNASGNVVVFDFGIRVAITLQGQLTTSIAHKI
ncbi:hypothetical protein K3495_g10540 [Podosphaera aphanis]|nr:hypothetical protein K3495_g10540 [Podosphaera aphanis]